MSDPNDDAPYRIYAREPKPAKTMALFTIAAVIAEVAAFLVVIIVWGLL